MPLIILSDVAGQDQEAVQQVRRKFEAAIADRFTVVAILYGTEGDTDIILETLEARASLQASIRRVVWVKNPAVLTGRQQEAYRRPGFPVVFVGLDDQVVYKLDSARAKSRGRVERGFTKASAADAVGEV